MELNGLPETVHALVFNCLLKAFFVCSFEKYTARKILTHCLYSKGWFKEINLAQKASGIRRRKLRTMRSEGFSFVIIHLACISLMNVIALREAKS